MQSELRKIVKKESYYEILKLNQFRGGFHEFGRKYSERGLLNFLKGNSREYIFQVSKELAANSRFRELTQSITGLDLITE